MNYGGTYFLVTPQPVATKHRQPFNSQQPKDTFFFLEQVIVQIYKSDVKHYKKVVKK